jgi:hypothetical protein
MCKVPDYLLLDNTLPNSDWSCAFNKHSIDFTVHNLTATMSKALNLATPFVKYRKYCIIKKKQFLEDMRNSNLPKNTIFSLTIINWLSLPLRQTGYIG